LSSLRTPAAATTTEDSTTSTIQIRSDFLALLSLLSKQTTNYTLALKNPPEEKAAFPTLEKIKDGVEKLKFLEELSRQRPGELDKRLRYAHRADEDVELLTDAPGDCHRWSLIESLESLSSFLSLSTSYLPPNPTTTSETHRKQLLSSCKTFWKVVEKIEQDLPKSELEAVRKTWKDVTGLIEDCEAELKELSEGRENDGGGFGDEDSDAEEEAEEEEEEDAAEKAELSETSKSIILTSSTLLRLSRLLVVRLLAFTESTNSSICPKFDSRPFLSNLTTLIKGFSEKADDLAGALDEVEEIEEDPSVGDGVKKIVVEVVETGESVEREVQIAIEGSGSDEEQTDKLKEWFKIWRSQRDQAQEKLSKLLAVP
jgi:hypothetical protein